MIYRTFDEIPPLHYGAILADPPWYFRNYSAKGEKKNPVAHYECVGTDSLAAMPVSHLAAPDCALFMWATAPMMPQAIDLMKAWGFTHKSTGAWAKQSSTGEAWAFGTGYCFRSAAEFYLLGTIGKPKVLSRSVRNLIVAPVREHSRKPVNLHDDVERLYAGPYLEMFAREERPGWDAFGNEVGRFDEPQPEPAGPIGSVQLRHYIASRRAGATTEEAAASVSMSLIEAQLWDADDAAGKLGWVRPIGRGGDSGAPEAA